MSIYKLPLTKLQPERKKWLAERNRLLSQEENDPQKQQLKTLLRGAAGEAAIIADYDYDIEAILGRARFFLGKDVLLADGAENQCHVNSALLWAGDRLHIQIVTGYALSKDGVWRQHSWCYNGSNIIETTVKRLLYFGFNLTDEEAACFYVANVLEQEC